MKKYYCILLFIIGTVVAVFSTEVGAKLNTASPIIQILAMSAFVIPLCILLFLMSRDKNIKRWIVLLSWLGTAFFVFCFIATLVVTNI